MSARPPANRRGPSRVAGIPALVAVIAIGAGAVLLDRTAPAPERPTAPPSGAIDGPTVPTPDAVSVAWYCAEGTSNEEGRADETVIVGNLAKNPIDVTVTVMPGDGAPVVERLQVDTLAQERIEIADIVEAAEPGVVVEVLGGQAVVEHEVRNGDDLAVGPCAREPSRDWYFAAGSTDRGAEEWLALFNPFGDDAIVDVSFLTSEGFQAPGDTESLVVPRRSRISVAIHEQISRQERVAIVVRASAGRVIAERTLLFDGTDTRSGIAVSLGATGVADHWRIVNGEAQASVAQSISIANFGDRPSDVEVSVRTAAGGGVEPETVDVPARGVVRVDFTDRVADGAAYAVDVRVTRGGPVVVEQFGTWAAPSPTVGVASAIASVTTADRWAFALGRIDEESEGVISVLNVSTRPLTVQLYAFTEGDPDSPASAPAQAVPAGQRTEFRVRDLGIRADMVLVVAADGPIVVGRRLDGAGASLTAGIPFA
jgi:hypothetical protein